jgi:hypothetical protein
MTMTKYHINDKGNPCPCTATVRQCPYGGPEDHFTSERDARAYYEVEMKISQLLKNELLGGTVVETKKTDSKILLAITAKDKDLLLAIVHLKEEVVSSAALEKSLDEADTFADAHKPEIARKVLLKIHEQLQETLNNNPYERDSRLETVVTVLQSELWTAGTAADGRAEHRKAAIRILTALDNKTKDSPIDLALRLESVPLASEKIQDLRNAGADVTRLLDLTDKHSAKILEALQTKAESSLSEVQLHEVEQAWAQGNWRVLAENLQVDLDALVGEEFQLTNRLSA